jgi:tetratricopeptide (TPR) repeat protein
MTLVLDKMGKYDESIETFQEVFNIQERVLGAEHPDTLATRYRIAFVLYNQDKFDEALVTFQEVFNIQERVLGAEHPDTLATKHRFP